MTFPEPNLERSENDRSGERVYAPASERVPVDPVPGHRDFVTHTDTHTPERQGNSAMPPPPGSSNAAPGGGDSPTPDPYASTLTNPAYAAYTDDSAWNAQSNRPRSIPFGVGWVMLGIGGGVGGWLYLRWRSERNKPINRLRRQAMQAAGEIRSRVPSSPEEAVRPAAGLTTALLSIALILWQQSRSRAWPAGEVVSQHTRKATRRADTAASRASRAVSDADLQKRLWSLKKRWDPSRLELEKISISRH